MTDLWTRRRQAVAAEKRAEEEALKTAERARNEAAQAEKTDEELLEELGLPDPDTLGEGDDFKRFLGEAVPARLKTRALRRLWRVNPVLANLDGLLDYGQDFTDNAMIVENMQTAYQVGKGMMAHVEELARQTEAKAAADRGENGEDSDDAPEAGGDEPEPESPEALEPVAIAEAAQEPQQREAMADAQEPEDYAAHRPVHRMTFTFDAKGAG